MLCLDLSMFLLSNFPLGGTSVARAAKQKHQEVRTTYDFVKNKLNVFEVDESFFDQ